MDFVSDCQSKILLTGLVRNVEKSLTRDINKISTAISPLGELDYFIVESDSTDQTLKILNELRIERLNFSFYSAGNLSEQFPNRIERLKFCRNLYVEEIRRRILEINYKYVIVADLDGINNKLNQSSLRGLDLLDFEWDALFANQNGRYYDIAALRHKFWSPNNCFESHDWWSDYQGKKLSKKTQVYDRMIKIKKESKPIEVDSAFGGFAIYKPWVFNIASYSDTLQNLDIDHVIFNQKITSAGGRLFILPSLINGGWNNHSIGSFKLFREIRYFLLKIPILLPLRYVLRRFKNLIIY